MAWHIAWGGSGTCSFGGLNANQTPILGSYWSTPTTTRTTATSPAYDDAPRLRVLTTWQALPEDSTGLCAWWCLKGFGVPPRTETTTLRPSLTRDPSQRAKSFAQNGEALKTSLGWRVQPIFLFVLGVMVFHRFALVHTRVGIQGTKYSCGSHYVEKISWRAKLPLHAART